MKAKAWSHKDDRRRKEPLHYTDCGLDDVYLCSGYDIVKTTEGEGLIVRDLDDLHKAIGLFLASKKKVLSGKELRYLRKHMDLSQSELGKLVGVGSQSVARWEKEECELPGAADRLLRGIYIQHAGGQLDLRKMVTTLDELDSSENAAFFENTGEGWSSKMTAAHC